MNFKYYFFLLLGICLFPMLVSAQQPDPYNPPRTPEEMAMKQTAMLIRELELSDSTQIDAIYRLHLKYAYLHRQGNTRQEELERMQQLFQELKGILSEEQYDAFMNRQITPGPRHPQQPVGPMPTHAPGEDRGHMPPPPPSDGRQMPPEP